MKSKAMSNGQQARKCLSMALRDVRRLPGVNARLSRSCKTCQALDDPRAFE